VIRAGRLVALVGAVALAAAACGPGNASPSAAVGPSSSVALVSPVDGLLTKLDSEGLTKVLGFRLRTDDGTEIPFKLGILENGAAFPPGHLAEHMATTSKVRVFFRDEGGEHVVYRLEDAPAP
jgi:hypothetical protein